MAGFPGKFRRSRAPRCLRGGCAVLLCTILDRRRPIRVSAYNRTFDRRVRPRRPGTTGGSWVALIGRDLDPAKEDLESRGMAVKLRGWLSLGASGLIIACGEGNAGADQAEFRPWQGPDTFVMIIPETLSADQFRSEAKAQCGSREFCKIVGWTSEEEAASGFPMTDRELETQAFGYGVNRVTGFEQAQWDCARFPRAEPEECLVK